jgi:hypothetical protein
MLAFSPQNFFNSAYWQHFSTQRDFTRHAKFFFTRFV